MSATRQIAPAKPLAATVVASSGLLQRKCACGGSASALDGKCASCRERSLQRKLAIGASNDPLEQEADRVADQVMAAPAHSPVSGAALHIQRFASQAGGQADTAPASVDQVLATPGRPLDAALRQDMEHRFGHDFSRVKVHYGGEAEQSAREVNANAYTVGHNVVFGAGRFAPGTHEGRRLIAHELAHVVQQRSGKVSGATSDTSGAIVQRSMQTYIKAMNQPEPDFKLAAEHLNGEPRSDIKIVLKNLSADYRVRLHKAARDWPGLCSNVGRLTEADYLKVEPTARTAAEVCTKTPPQSTPSPRAATEPLLADPAQDQKFIDNAFKSAGIPILGGPVCFSEQPSFSAFAKHICIGRAAIHHASDPLTGQTVTELTDVFASEAEARAAVKKWQEGAPSGIAIVGYYKGIDGYIFPTIISATTAPRITGVSARGYQEEAAYGKAASSLLVEAWLTGAGLRAPLKASDSSLAKPAAGAGTKVVLSVEQALGAKKYAEMLKAVEAVRKARPELAALSLDEMIAIRAYTGEAWAGINAALRGVAKTTPSSEALARAMLAGLKKLPGFTGKLVRSEALAINEAQSLYRQGATVIMDGFTSTSRAGAVAQREGNIAMSVIATGKNGKDVTQLSVHIGKEAEVLFLPGTKFLVQKAETVGDALIVILKEL